MKTGDAMKKKRRGVLLVLLVFLLGLVFGTVWVWKNHKAMLILQALEIIAPKQEGQTVISLPPADTLEAMLSLPGGTTDLPKDKKIVIPASVQKTVDAVKQGDTPEETEKKTKKHKQQINEWVQLFSYLLPDNVKPEDIAEEDVDVVVAIVRTKMTTGEVMKLTAYADGGLTNDEKMLIHKKLSEKFTEDELTVLVQIYRKYTE